ncbi:MAG: CDP-diacylglycerol--glycerol-3-phosphate 3-phosphatidyltransferase [Planctomycetota bacterium]
MRGLLALNLPNQVTVARLVLAAFLFVLLEMFCRAREEGLFWYIAFALYVVTVLTDGLDGYLARSRGQITAFGRIADPFADKIVICGVLVLTHNLPQTTHLVPSWIVLVVLAREFLVSGLRGYLEGQGRRFGARWEGKTKLVIQAIYCGAVLFYAGDRMGWVEVVAQICLWATLVITLFSALAYVRSAVQLLGDSAEI